jgi:hypothetical protein
MEPAAVSSTRNPFFGLGGLLKGGSCTRRRDADINGISAQHVFQWLAAGYTRRGVLIFDTCFLVDTAALKACEK